MSFSFNSWKYQMRYYLHCACLYAAFSLTLAHNDTNTTHATAHNDTDTLHDHSLSICDLDRMEIVEESYVANDIPDMEAIKKCQEMIRPNPDMPAPRPCAIPVKITITLIDLVDIDGIKGSIQMMMTYQEQWEDRRIILPAHMNPDCVDNSTRKSFIHLTPSVKYRNDLWTPDFYMKGMMGIHVAKVGLTAEDLVLRDNYVVESTLTLTLSLMCPMHFSKFPFDSHQCNITIESFGMFADDLAILWSEHGVRLSRSFVKEGYKISVVTGSPAFVMYSGFPFPRLVMTLIISRQRLRYTLLVFVPCILHFMIAWLAFFLPKEVSQGRCIINCTTNLSLISMLSVYMRYSPQGGHLKSFDIWVVFSMVFQFLCTIDSIIDIRLLYLAFNLRQQPEQPDTTEVLHLVTNTDNWLGREMRHVEPEISSNMVRSAVHEMRRLSASPSASAALRQQRASQAPQPPSMLEDISIYTSETYQKFLSALVLYQEWSQWIYLGGYMMFVWLYWYIHVPKELH
ncbi:gamma-aminobutyric acid receptor subunit rho-2-like [Amphibalanus amphitrite]|nr:gamma-aminobutyric acid receptor subunit rho-2-like [Amphibalanus amphitrite]